MKRLYDARPSNIRPFMDRMKLHISELDLPNVNIHQRNLLIFQPWNTPRFHYINPFASYSKSTVRPVVFQRVFAYHRSQYRMFSAVYTDGSKRGDYVGCGFVIEDVMHGYRLDPSCSVFTAEAVAIYHALQSIDPNMPRKYCMYTDSISVLEALENYNDLCHPVVCNILDITSRLYSKGFNIVFCWLPSHVGIIGNEQADSAARSAKTHLPLAVPLSDMKRVILHHIFKIWQESWSQQLDNKLHPVKPVIGAWPVMPMRRTDVKLTRLRIVSPKRHCCWVSAADKGWRVYPLDHHPDAVSLYSGCTLGKRCAWYLPHDRHTVSLVGLRGGWRHARMNFFLAPIDPHMLCPGKGIVLPNLNIDNVAKCSCFLILCLPNSKMSRKSQFVVHKAIIGIGGELKSLY
ncbi:RNase H domain-containing protein [Trichonephila clavipes]|nr:RNase H domain-containing protein [Trichonephila clavipes]